MSEIATLMFDSAQVGSIVAARSVVSGDRSLLFAAAGVSIDLVVYASPDGVSVIHGQVVDADGESPVVGATVTLGGEEEIVETDQYGQFSLSSTEPLGDRSVTIFVGEHSVECPIPEVDSAAEDA